MKMSQQSGIYGIYIFKYYKNEIDRQSVVMKNICNEPAHCRHRSWPTR